MRVCIVGHGPSLLAEECGEIIDDHDRVVRVKRCHDTLRYPLHYGTRTDALAASVHLAGQIRDIPAGEYWLIVDSRHPDPEPVVGAAQRLLARSRTRCDIELCREWDARYRDRRTPVEGWPEGMKPSRYADSLGERHLSQGFKALLYACRFWEPDEITLAGYDNVMTGDFTWSVTRGPEWTNYPTHRWDIEHEMLKDVEEMFRVKLRVLMPEHAEVTA